MDRNIPLFVFLFLKLTQSTHIIIYHVGFISNLCLITTGLNLELNIEQEDYIGVLAPEAGIRMDISTQGEMPFPLERGVSLAPGYATMIGLRKVTKTAEQSTMKVQLVLRQQKPCTSAIQKYCNYMYVLLRLTYLIYKIAMEKAVSHPCSLKPSQLPLMAFYA